MSHVIVLPGLQRRLRSLTRLAWPRFPSRSVGPVTRRPPAADVLDAVAVVRQRRMRRIFAISSLLLFSVFVVAELRTSRIQARLLSDLAGSLTFHVQSGPNPAIRFPSDGPFDVRLGYARIPGFLSRLEAESYDVTAQARVSPNMDRIQGLGLFPVYREKTQTGLVLLDESGKEIYRATFPSQAYGSFADIPDVVVRTLLYIENKELLDGEYPYHNPAFEWDRLTLAVMSRGLKNVGVDASTSGASTLATQLEKLRHSPGGRTDSPAEKLRQMATASLRSYLEGTETLPAQRRIVTDYLNLLPLAGSSGFGEIIGLADGLRAWYNVDFSEVNRLLGSSTPDSAEIDLHARAVAYRQVLSLLVANRRPSYYLANAEGRAALSIVTNYYLRALAREGIISDALRDDAMNVELAVSLAGLRHSAAHIADVKSSNAIRSALLANLGLPGLYELDRLDLSVATTLNVEAQQRVTGTLNALSGHRSAGTPGNGFAGLLQGLDPEKVQYAVVLYEAEPDGNAVRVQADNFDGPFNLNEGAKLELGSTAKLRTLVNYLQVIETLYQEDSGSAGVAEDTRPARPRDVLTTWADSYRRQHSDASLAELLEAAMNRTYSASPNERFFTGGGIHAFNNFNAEDNQRAMSVREAFRNSVNLVFIRVMRDIVGFYAARLPGNPASMLANGSDPRRQAYLERFAEREGTQFLRGYYRVYAGLTSSEAMDAFNSRHKLSARRRVWAFRAIDAQADFEDFSQFADRWLDGTPTASGIRRKLFDSSDPVAWGWQDRGYLAGVHPLELWLLSYLREHPQASWPEVCEAAKPVSLESYRWLFSSSRKAGQDARIKTLIEEDAFAEIHKAWKAVGYPFERLIPSYATAIGSSADRPTALAELMGIIARDGVHYPVKQLEALTFGADTPFETQVERHLPVPERVLSHEVARTVQEALVDVVENGTARRVRGAFVRHDGAPRVVGGKTGTGDNRIKRYATNGTVSTAEAMNRTATFAFFVDDRVFGVVTAFVPGEEASGYRFTSSLPAQIARELEPVISDLIDERPDSSSIAF